MKREKGSKIILFDGVCNLCNGLVKFIIKRDRRDEFRFAPLQSSTGEELLAKHKLLDAQLDSIVLITDEDYAIKSLAALRIFKELKGYRWLWGFRFLPRSFRDFCYDFVAHNRYRWFGKKEACMLPTPELRAKFLD